MMGIRWNNKMSIFRPTVFWYISRSFCGHYVLNFSNDISTTGQAMESGMVNGRHSMRRAILALSMILLCVMAFVSPTFAEKVSRPITAWPFVLHSGDEDRAETDVLWPIFLRARKDPHSLRCKTLHFLERKRSPKELPEDERALAHQHL
jgi:hypothetical protein